MVRGMVVGLVAMVFAGPVLVMAHAFLDHAEPRVGSSVERSPPAVTLFFTEPVEPAFSRIEIEGEGGKKLATEAIRHPAPDRLELPLPPLAAGEYTVRWAVVSVDTHPTEGRFTFSVKGGRD